MNVNPTQSGSVDKWMDGLVGAKKAQQSNNPTIQQSSAAVESLASAPVKTDVTAFAPLETADAARAAIQNLTKNFLAQPKVALLAQATEFSENALRLLQ